MYGTTANGSKEILTSSSRKSKLSRSRQSRRRHTSYFTSYKVFYITVSYAVTCAPFLLKVYCEVWQWDGLGTRIMHTVKKALTTIVDTASKENLHGWCPGNNDRVTLPTATAKDIQNPLCILVSFSLEFHLPYWRDLTQTIDCFPFMIAVKLLHIVF